MKKERTPFGKRKIKGSTQLSSKLNKNKGVTPVTAKNAKNNRQKGDRQNNKQTSTKQIIRGINGYTKKRNSNSTNTHTNVSTDKFVNKFTSKHNKDTKENIPAFVNMRRVNTNNTKRGSKAHTFEQFRHFKGIYFDSSNSAYFNATYSNPSLSNSFYSKPSSHKGGLSLYTKSKSFRSVYGEKVIEYKGDPYRFWEPKRSKICSAIHCGISQIGMIPGKRVLYLGASSGTTVSHVSDILGDEGMVFAVEFSDIPAKKLYFLAKERNNILPILSDARNPKSYFPITGICDVVFQDISQKDQVEIFFKNCDLILRSGGFGILSLKTRSIDVSLSPKAVFSKVKPILEKEMTLVDYRSLEPFEEGHYIFVLKK